MRASGGVGLGVLLVAAMYELLTLGFGAGAAVLMVLGATLATMAALHPRGRAFGWGLGLTLVGAVVFVLVAVWVLFTFYGSMFA
jgi:hypothetical protein